MLCFGNPVQGVGAVGVGVCPRLRKQKIAGLNPEGVRLGFSLAESMQSLPVNSAE